MATLSHPNIVAAYAVGDSEGQPFFVREFVEGQTLEQAIQSGSIDLRQGIAALATVANAIAQVHSQGIIHRGLEPSNIVVADNGTPKLIGFGRARCAVDVSLSEELTRPITPEIDISALQELLRWLCSTLGRPVPDKLAVVAHGEPPPTTATFAEKLAQYLESEPAQARPRVLNRLRDWLWRK